MGNGNISNIFSHIVHKMLNLIAIFSIPVIKLTDENMYTYRPIGPAHTLSSRWYALICTEHTAISVLIIASILFNKLSITALPLLALDILFAYCIVKKSHAIRE